MKITAHQPNFMPNLSFFSKMKQVDTFVIITNIQYEKREGWQHRNKIHTAHGDMWLTVPVYGSQNKRIKDITICYQEKWTKRHIRTLETVYSKTVGHEYLSLLKSTYSSNYERLVDLNFQFILTIKEVLGIPTNVILDEELVGQKHEIFVNVANKYNADTYVSGLGAKNYLTDESIQDVEKKGIRHEYVSKDMSIYPYSSIHYLLKEGKEWTGNVL